MSLNRWRWPPDSWRTREKPVENSTAPSSALRTTATPFSPLRKEWRMNIVKWTPFRELEDMQTRLNRFFGDAPMRTFEADAPFFADWVPPVDVEETDKEYLIKAELPEIAKENVKVEMLDGVLTIEGERKREKEEKDKKFLKVERLYGKFVRQFALPAEVDAVKIQAEFKDGVLNVHLPKTAAAKPKAIEVKVH